MDKEARIEALVITLNNQALKLLKEENPSFSISKLDQALQVLHGNLMKDYSELYWMTYNNYGILLKKCKRFEQAVDCFIHASKYCQESPVKFSECMLRACNIYSKLKKHKKALKLALKSIKILSYSTHHIKIIAYQNAGAEYEYLKMRPEAVSMYKSGYSFVKRLFGSQNSLAQMFKSRYKELDSFTQTKKHSGLNIISSKPSRFEPFTSKTPEMKADKTNKFSLIKPAPSLRTIKDLKSFGSLKNNQIKSKTPDKLKSVGFNLDTIKRSNKLNGSALLIVEKKKKFNKIKEGLDGLFMVDSKRNTPKNMGARHLDPIIFSLDSKF